MQKWIKSKDYQELSMTLTLLRQHGIVGTGMCYQLSDPKYILINFEDKRFYLGCKYPSKIKQKNMITLSELIFILKEGK